jgi:RNA polymerase sigma-70 factor (ECF subfamily)
MVWGRANRRRKDFEKASLEHLDSLYGMAVRLTRDERDAEDLVQDTYVRALRFQDRFEPGTNMRAWLLRILTNTFINRYRRRQKERQLADQLEAGPDQEALLSTHAQAQLRDPEKQLQIGILREELARAVDELPDEFRVAVVLADVYGFSYKEIASVLDCPIGTVMSRLHRARRALQARLMDQAIAAGLVSRHPSAELDSERAADLAAYRRRRGGAA